MQNCLIPKWYSFKGGVKYGVSIFSVCWGVLKFQSLFLIHDEKNIDDPIKKKFRNSHIVWIYK